MSDEEQPNLEAIEAERCGSMSNAQKRLESAACGNGFGNQCR